MWRKSRRPRTATDENTATTLVASVVTNSTRSTIRLQAIQAVSQMCVLGIFYENNCYPYKHPETDSYNMHNGVWSGAIRIQCSLCVSYFMMRSCSRSTLRKINWNIDIGLILTNHGQKKVTQEAWTRSWCGAGWISVHHDNLTGER